MKQYFHFTIGPVQSFVAQARRSKDLWSGSFLLSWLSAVAIAAVRHQHQDNQILFPIPDDAFMQAVTGQAQQGPKQGCIPNRFKAAIAADSSQFAGQDVTAFVQIAWQQVAELVWKNDLEPFFASHTQFSASQSLSIWQRQTENIWDIHWVLTDNPDVSNLLDQRKNWRDHYPAPEPGDKCMMMSGWQELSGEHQAQKRRDYWEALRQYLVTGKSDLEEGEQLCALGFIKRRFAHYFSELQLDSTLWPKLLPQGFSMQAPKLCGWSFAQNSSAEKADYDPTHVPSLPFLAALPYLRKAYDAVAKKPELKPKLLQFAELAAKQQPEGVGLAGRFVKVSSLEQCLNSLNLPSWISHIDGISYFSDSLLAGQSYKHIRTGEIVRRLKEFNKSATLPEASPYYALLLMDGDLLGKQMTDPAKHSGISAALNNFTRDVPGIVQSHDGFLIYAGGDDVLAFLPMDTAIECARAIERCYSLCFAKESKGSGLSSTLSGAIQFAHYRTPLMKIVAEAHDLLDRIAKDQTGRDALAIRINKPGGVHAEWAMPWSNLYPDNQQQRSVVQTALTMFEEKSASITNKLLFKLIDSLSIFTESDMDDQVITQLAQAEYFHSGIQLHMDKKLLRHDMQNIKQLMQLCRVVKSNSAECKPALQLDGLKLIRFLATAGAEQQQELA